MAWLRQRDGVTCGPSVAVMAGALIDADYGAALEGDGAQQWFDSEQGRVHRAVNTVWPRALGTTPAGMARALSAHGMRYRWRPATGRDALLDVSALDGATVRCYEPSSGRLVAIDIDDIRSARLEGLGFPRAFAFVLPAG